MRIYGWITGICFVSIVNLVTISVPVCAQEKIIKLKFANYFPPTHDVSINTEQWCKEVETRTKGKVKIVYLPGGTLVPAPQAYDAAVNQIADISLASQSWSPGRFPLTEVLELPLGYSSCVQGTRVANAFYKKFKPKEFDDVKVLYFWSPGPGYVMTVKPVPSLEGLAGLKLRAGGNQTKVALAIGATPVSIPMSDIYEGLHRGVIQGMLFYPESLKGWKFADLIRGMQDNRGMKFTGGGVIVMNKQKWNSLPPDIQKVIEEVSEEWIDKVGAVFDKIANEGIDYGRSKGMKVFEATPKEVETAVAKMKPILDNYVQEMDKKGLPGKQALTFCQDFIASH